MPDAFTDVVSKWNIVLLNNVAEWNVVSACRHVLHHCLDMAKFTLSLD